MHALARPVEALSALHAVIARVDEVACPPDPRSELRWLVARELHAQRGAAERARVLALLDGADALLDPKDIAGRDRLRAALR